MATKKASTKKKAATKKAATKNNTGPSARAAKKSGSGGGTNAAGRARNADTAAFIQRFAKKSLVQVQTADTARSPYWLRRPTGILSLDIALGGGFHAGGTGEIWGPESAGKTFLTYLTAREVQKNYGEDSRILIFKTEMREDKDFARRAGLVVAYNGEEIEEMQKIRKDRFGYPDFTKEELEDLQMQVGDILYVTAATADHGFDAIVESLDANIFQLVIVDSLGALLTKSVEEGATGDAHYAGGGSSRAITQFMNKVYPRLIMDRADGTMNETTVLGINQVRAKMGGGGNSKFAGANEKRAADAWAWRHGQMISLRIDKGTRFKVEKDPESKGHEVRWRTEKGKGGTHDGLVGTYDYWHFERKRPVFLRDAEEDWQGGVAYQEDLVAAAKAHGVIEVNGAWYTMELGGEVHRAQGEAAFAQILADHPELGVELREETLRAAQIMARFR